MNINAIRTALKNATIGTLFRTSIDIKTIYVEITDGNKYDPNDTLLYLWKIGEDVLGEGVVLGGKWHKIILAR